MAHMNDIGFRYISNISWRGGGGRDLISPPNSETGSRVYRGFHFLSYHLAWGMRRFNSRSKGRHSKPPLTKQSYGFRV